MGPVTDALKWWMSLKWGGAYSHGCVTVEAEVLKDGRGKKVHILKFRRRKHHMKQMGHRQSFTEIKITRISIGVLNMAHKKSGR